MQVDQVGQSGVYWWSSLQQPSGAGPGAVIALVLPALRFSSRLQCYAALEGSAGGLLSGNKRPTIIEKKAKKERWADEAKKKGQPCLV